MSKKILQDQFKKFHKAIRIKNLNEDEASNYHLREKRDMLLKKLREYIDEKWKDNPEEKPRFEWFNQGSYSMGTGVKPLAGNDFDIDIGISFRIAKFDYPNPVTVKNWVYEALQNSFRIVEMRTPCVRVQYKKDGENHYHVDFAIYSDKECNGDEQTYIAKGRLRSAEVNRIWEISCPKELKKKVNDRFMDVDKKKQFKRAIRYLKRWKDYIFLSSGNSAPTGIALTALAYDWFRPNLSYNSFTSEVVPNDILALKDFTTFAIAQKDFWTGRMKVSLPVPPNNNLFEKMTDSQLNNLELKFKELRDNLTAAIDETDPCVACEILQKKVFGDDFPVPDKESTGQKRSVAVIGSVEQA